MRPVSYACLVACTSRKSEFPTTAEFLYQSPLFFGARAYAEGRSNSWFILSAKFGLLEPQQGIEPYNQTLVRLSHQQRQTWGARAFEAIKERVSLDTHIIFLAGEPYRKPLEPLLTSYGYHCSAPLSALGIGSQVAWLQRLQAEKVRLADLDRVYELLGRLKRGRESLLLKRHTSSQLPRRGVYFFFEPGETRMTSPAEDRVVRVGTHSVSRGSKATLWGRLRTHKGAGDGSGNHRGSIFRLHVGNAILNKSGLSAEFPTWGVGQSATKEVRSQEEPIEQQVSEVIGHMPVLWLEVNDEPSADSDRTYLERNLIALLSGPTLPLDLPSSQWLGRFSNRESIRDSGLWNVNHVYEKYDRHALDVLEAYVQAAEGKIPPITRSLAPSGWRHRARDIDSPDNQLSLI